MTMFKNLEPVAKFVQQYDQAASDLAELGKIKEENTAKLTALLESGDIKNEVSKREAYDWGLTDRMIPFRETKLHERIERLEVDMMVSVSALLREVADYLEAFHNAVFERLRGAIAGQVREDNIDAAARALFPYAQASPALVSIGNHKVGGGGHGIESARRLLMACEEIQELAKDVPEVKETVEAVRKAESKAIKEMERIAASEGPTRVVRLG